MRNTRLWAWFSFVFCVAGVVPFAWAGGTRSFRATTYQDFAEGQEYGVAVTSSGDVLPGWSLSKVELPAKGEDSVRSLVLADGGAVYVGTGGEHPNVLRIRDGKFQKLASLPAGSFVSALAVRKTPTGNHVLAATVGDGRIFDLSEDGKVEVWATTGAEHIWALLRDGEQTLVASSPGRLVLYDDKDCGAGQRLGPNEKTKGKLLFESPARHFLALAKAQDGVYYAGTSDEAILYRVSLGNAGTVTVRAVHDFAGNEVRAIAARNGQVFVAVNDMQRGDTQQRGLKINMPPGGSVPGVKAAPPTGTTVPPSTSPVEKKGRGGLFRVDETGRVEQLHAISDGFFNDLVVDSDGNVLAAASTPGNRGRLYRVMLDRTVFLAAELKESDALTLLWNEKERLVGTGSAAGLYRIRPTPADPASYLSKVFDATAIARFGTMRYLGTGLRVETRSGNVQKPDGAWSPWQTLGNLARIPSTQEQTGEILSPQARYLQIRFGFSDKSVLKDFFVYYQPLNQRPRVTEISVGEDPLSRIAKGQKTSLLRPKSPLLKIRWKVENPDEDELNYRVFVRRVSSGIEPQAGASTAFAALGWLRLSGPEPIVRTELDLNGETIGDGLFEIKVIVTDERSNSPGLALSHELRSAPFLVDNRRPEWQEVRFLATEQVIVGKISDIASSISDLSIAIDGGDFLPMTSRDGMLDGLSEEIRHPVSGLSPGFHTVLLRGSDAADNVATTQLVIQTK